jgi:hypothetical protein
MRGTPAARATVCARSAVLHHNHGHSEARLGQTDRHGTLANSNAPPREKHTKNTHRQSNVALESPARRSAPRTLALFCMIRCNMAQDAAGEALIAGQAAPQHPHAQTHVAERQQDTGKRVEHAITCDSDTKLHYGMNESTARRRSTTHQPRDRASTRAASRPEVRLADDAKLSHQPCVC